jgi:hypothetical protein
MLIEFSYIKENSSDIFKDLELVGKGYTVKSLKFDASESNAIIANAIIPTPVVNDMLIGIYSILHAKYGMGHKEFISKINKSKLKLDYTIVFGDSQLPQVIDRYKLIRLPLTCAYRPRYWSALAHEVSHSFITSLLLFEKVLNDVSIFNDEEGKLASTILSYIKRRELKGKNGNYTKINYIGYMYDIIEYVFKRLTQDSCYLEALGYNLKNKRKKLNDHTEIFKFKNAYVGEIVADVFGFLFSGYAYIPALIANTALGRLPKVDPLYLVRMGVIIGIGEGFYYDFIKEEKILNNEE